MLLIEDRRTGWKPYAVGYGKFVVWEVKRKPFLHKMLAGIFSTRAAAEKYVREHQSRLPKQETRR